MFLIMVLIPFYGNVSEFSMSLDASAQRRIRNQNDHQQHDRRTFSQRTAKEKGSCIGVIIIVVFDSCD